MSVRGRCLFIATILAGTLPGTYLASAAVRGAVLPAILTGSSRQPSEEVASLLPGHRCMALAGVRPVSVLSQPRAGSRRLGPVPDPVITADPPRVVNGYAQTLQRNGQPGWVRRNRLREWAVAASPGLRCLPARMLDGSLGFTYAHPG